MKRKNLLPLAISVIALVSACNTTQTSSAAAEGAISTDSVKTQEQPNIVYINTDSLYAGYHLFVDLKADFDAKAQKSQSQIESRGKSLERKIQDFQNKVQKGLVTRATAADMEQKLTKEQQDFVAFRDAQLASLQEEEAVMGNNISYNVSEFMNKYNEEKKYDLILSTNAMTSTVVVGDKKLDITADVLEGLNKEYAESKTKEE